MSTNSRLMGTVAALCVAAAACHGQASGPGLLFAKGDGGLSSKDQALIFDALWLEVDSAGTGFLDKSCGQPADAIVSFSDWNGDGRPEVLVISGNTCTSGMAGSSALLFIQDSTGSYRPNLGFPAASAEPQPTANLGYPDLRIGGPGFCFPIWRWNGSEYEHLRQEPQMAGGCDNR